MNKAINFKKVAVFNPLWDVFGNSVSLQFELFDNNLRQLFAADAASARQLGCLKLVTIIGIHGFLFCCLIDFCWRILVRPSEPHIYNSGSDGRTIIFPRSKAKIHLVRVWDDGIHFKKWLVFNPLRNKARYCLASVFELLDKNFRQLFAADAATIVAYDLEGIVQTLLLLLVGSLLPLLLQFSSWSMGRLSWRWACSVPTKTWSNIVSPFPSSLNKQQSHHSWSDGSLYLGLETTFTGHKGCHPFSEFPFWRCKDKHISLIFQTFSQFFLFWR